MQFPASNEEFFFFFFQTDNPQYWINWESTKSYLIKFGGISVDLKHAWIAMYIKA